MEERIKKLEEGIMRLKAEYEQYFRGVSNKLPEKLAGDVAREVKVLSSTSVPNTALKFRLRQAVSRYQTFLNYWNKILKGIEDGRIQRRSHQESKAVVVEGNTFVFSTPEKESGEMERMIRRLRMEYRQAGAQGMPAVTRIRQMLVDQTRMVRDKFKVNEVAYEIATEGEKVRIKVKPLKNKKG